MADVVIIGSGIVGAGAAYHLARQGAEVVVVDRADPGQATAAGAGIISPGTSIGVPEAYLVLAYQAMEHYPRLLEELAEDGETDTGYAVAGGLFIATNDEEAGRLPAVLSEFEERWKAGHRNIGRPSLVSTQEAQERFPALADIPAAIWTPEVARIDGARLRDALRRAARGRGVTRIEGNAVPVRSGNHVTGVSTGREVIPAGAVIIAAGAWSNSLVEPFGAALPVYPQRGQIAHLELPDTDTTAWPVITGFHSHYLLAFPRNRVVAGATREHDAGFDYRMTAAGVHETLHEALRVAPGLGQATLHEVRVGFRPFSPDQLPVLGPVPPIDNLFIATGHGPSGLQLGPYSGVVVADLARGETVPLDLEPFAITRFAR